MNKDEMKNRISLALKDPILQQGFEIICKENATLKEDYECLEDAHNVLNELYEKLEKENAELKEKLKTAYRKGMRHMAKALKDYDRTDGAWTDYFEHTVDKVLQREQLDFEKYGTLADQLTKAKEIIKELNEGLDKLYLSGLSDKQIAFIEQLQDKAEQFLKNDGGPLRA